jgi:hypothetical protein
VAEVSFGHTIQRLFGRCVGGDDLQVWGHHVGDVGLIKYGLHNFVTCAMMSGKHIFLIKNMESQNMIHHAMNLIEESFGETAEIQVI